MMNFHKNQKQLELLNSFEDILYQNHDLQIELGTQNIIWKLKLSKLKVFYQRGCETVCYIQALQNTMYMIFNF